MKRNLSILVASLLLSGNCLASNFVGEARCDIQPQELQHSKRTPHGDLKSDHGYSITNVGSTPQTIVIHYENAIHLEGNIWTTAGSERKIIIIDPGTTYTDNYHFSAPTTWGQKGKFSTYAETTIEDIKMHTLIPRCLKYSVLKVF